MAKGGRRRSSRRAGRSEQEWTGLEKALGVLVAILAVVAVYAFTVREEVVEVGSIETYAATVDLRPGEGTDTYSFSRELKADYQVVAKFKVGAGGSTVHFEVANRTTGQVLVNELTAYSYDNRIAVDPGEHGTYEFRWWVEGGSSASRVDIDVLIEPTEKLFEKRR
jgi:hypothetical protein